MIIGGDKKRVIRNIRKNANEGNLNSKVEIDDPIVDDDTLEKAVYDFFKYRQVNPREFWIKSRGAELIQAAFGLAMTSSIKVEGLEKLNLIKNGAIVTSNHFNPLDSLCVRKVIRKQFHKDPYIVIQDTNLMMTGLIGYLMNNLKTIPIRKGPKYLKKVFIPKLKNLVDYGEFVLIYPEEEMWFNYRKPRPCKRGTYMFATVVNAPIIPIFVEMIDTEKEDNEQFYKVKYVAHVLEPIYPDKNKNIRKNSIEMARKDYLQRVEAYEKIYHKKLDYKFRLSDIAGWRRKARDR